MGRHPKVNLTKSVVKSVAWSYCWHSWRWTCSWRDQCICWPPGCPVMDKDDVADWLENDANDPGHQLLDDGEIVQTMLHADSDEEDSAEQGLMKKKVSQECCSSRKPFPSVLVASARYRPPWTVIDEVTPWSRNEEENLSSKTTQAVRFFASHYKCECCCISHCAVHCTLCIVHIVTTISIAAVKT